MVAAAHCPGPSLQVLGLRKGVLTEMLMSSEGRPGLKIVLNFERYVNRSHYRSRSLD